MSARTKYVVGAVAAVAILGGAAAAVYWTNTQPASETFTVKENPAAVSIDLAEAEPAGSIAATVETDGLDELAADPAVSGETDALETGAAPAVDGLFIPPAVPADTGAAAPDASAPVTGEIQPE